MLDSQYSVNRLESVTFSPPGTPLVIVAKERQTLARPCGQMQISVTVC